MRWRTLLASLRFCRHLAQILGPWGIGFAHTAESTISRQDRCVSVAICSNHNIISNHNQQSPYRQIGLVLYAKRTISRPEWLVFAAMPRSHHNQQPHHGGLQNVHLNHNTTCLETGSALAAKQTILPRDRYALAATPKSSPNRNKNSTTARQPTGSVQVAQAIGFARIAKPTTQQQEQPA